MSSISAAIPSSASVVTNDPVGTVGAAAEGASALPRDYDEPEADSSEEEYLSSHETDSGEYEAKIPCYLFFYGTLQKESVLRSITRSRNTKTIPAIIKSYRLKLWGPYPTAVPAAADAVIEGHAWLCEDEEHFRRLARYETEAYTWATVEIRLKTGEVVKGRTFVWSAEEDHADLSEGVWKMKDMYGYGMFDDDEEDEEDPEA